MLMENLLSVSDLGGAILAHKERGSNSPLCPTKSATDKTVIQTWASYRSGEGRQYV